MLAGLRKLVGKESGLAPLAAFIFGGTVTLEQKIEAWIVCTTLGGLATWWLSRGIEALIKALRKRQ